MLQGLLQVCVCTGAKVLHSVPVPLPLCFFLPNKRRTDFQVACHDTKTDTGPRHFVLFPRKSIFSSRPCTSAVPAVTLHY
jgi:hypothetical protein